MTSYQTTWPCQSQCWSVAVGVRAEQPAVDLQLGQVVDRREMPGGPAQRVVGDEDGDERQPVDDHAAHIAADIRQREAQHSAEQPDREHVALVGNPHGDDHHEREQHEADRSKDRPATQRG